MSTRRQFLAYGQSKLGTTTQMSIFIKGHHNLTNLDLNFRIKCITNKISIHYQPFQQCHFQPQNMQQGSRSSSSGMSLEEIVKSLATSTQSFQNETNANI